MMGNMMLGFVDFGLSSKYRRKFRYNVGELVVLWI